MFLKFVIFEKGYEQKIVLGIFRFLSMLFNIIIFKCEWGYKNVWVLCVYFLQILLLLKNYYYKKGYMSIFEFVSILF